MIWWSLAEVQQLLNVYSEYSEEHDIKYNALKSVIMISRTKKLHVHIYMDYDVCR